MDEPRYVLCEFGFAHPDGRVWYRREVILTPERAKLIDQLLNYDTDGERLPAELQPRGQS